MKQKLIYAGIGALVLVAIAVAFRPQPVLVPFTQPETRAVREFVSEEAETRLADRYIIDMPVTGTVQRVRFDVGDTVQEGDVVARIDPHDIQRRIDEVKARVAQARAQASGVDVQKPKPEEIESARLHVEEMQTALEVTERARRVIALNLEEAEREFERARGLFEAGAVAKSFLDDAETRYRSLTEDAQRATLEVQAARKALEQARLTYERISGSIDDNEYIRETYLAEAAALEAQLALLKNDLRKTDIRSPVSGPILDKFIEDSRVLQAGTPLLTIGDMDSIEIESDILSEEVTQIDVEDAVEIFGKALRGRTVLGHVKRIYPAGFEKISSLGIEQQRVKILVEFDNSEVALRPGTRVDIRVITDESPNALAVPDRAVFRTGNEWFVFKVDGGRAVQTPVEIGLRNDEWAEIRSGLTPDDTIIAELTNDLADGARVVAL